MDETQVKVFMELLESNYLRIRHLEEKIDCILHTLCEHDDCKTHRAIRKYLESDYRNIKK